MINTVKRAETTKCQL